MIAQGGWADNGIAEIFILLLVIAFGFGFAIGFAVGRFRRGRAEKSEQQRGFPVILNSQDKT